MLLNNLDKAMNINYEMINGNTSGRQELVEIGLCASYRIEQSHKILKLVIKGSQPATPILMGTKVSNLLILSCLA